MTIKELYEEAVKAGCENYEVEKDDECGGFCGAPYIHYVDHEHKSVAL